MVAALVVMSVMCVLGWPALLYSRHQRRMVEKDEANYAGRLVPVGPGFFYAVAGSTLFTAAVWVLVLSGVQRNDSPGVRGDVVIALIAAALVFAIFLIVTVYTAGRSRSGPSGSARQQMDSGVRDTGYIGTHIGSAVDFSARPGEYRVGEYPANHVQRMRGRGGRLFLTSERLTFMPGEGSRSLGARDWQLELRDVLKADVAPRGWGLWDGSLRHRLRVAVSSGNFEYFVVWHPKELAKVINDQMLKNIAATSPKEGLRFLSDF